MDLLDKKYEALRKPLNMKRKQFITGKLEPNEDPLEAAKRELIEETGYEALERQRGVRRPNRKLTRREKKALKRAQKYEAKLHKEHEKADKKNAKKEAKLAAKAEKQAMREAKKSAKKKKSSNSFSDGCKKCHS